MEKDDEEYVHFLKLNEEKQERILAAAYDEFLEKGYNEASTNTITHKAGISKGLLFRYFGCKQGLYKFLMKESAQRITQEILPNIPVQSGDVFTMIKSIVQLKIMVCLRFPKETSFLISAWTTNLPEGLLRDRETIANMSDNYLGILLNLLDSSLLRDGVEKKVAVEIISWVCEKYADAMLSNGTLNTTEESFNFIAKDLEGYMDVLRHGLYK